MKKFIFLSLIALCFVPTAQAVTPSNEELYQMIQGLTKQLEESRQELRGTKEELKRTREELVEIKEVPRRPTVIRPTRAELLLPEEKGQAIYSNVEYLLLKPRRSSPAEFAIEDGDTDQIPEGLIHSAEWDLESGFRYGGGYRLPNGAEIGVSYTRLETSIDQSANAPSGGTLWAVLSHADGGGAERVSSAKLLDTLDFQTFDIEGAKRFSLTDKLTGRGSFGLRLAWIDEKLTVDYDGVTVTADHIEVPIDFDGAGFRFGGQLDWSVLSDWFVFQNITVFGRGYESILAGDFSVSFTEIASGTVRADIAEDFDRPVSVLELGLGTNVRLKEFHILSVPFRILLTFGFEMQNWQNLLDGFKFVDDIDEGKFEHQSSDLGFYGFNFGFRTEIPWG